MGGLALRAVGLLVLEMQRSLVGDPALWDGPGLLARVKDIVAACHREEVPVIYAQQDNGAGDPISRGEPGWEIHPELTLARQDTVIHKTAADAFYRTHLKNELDMRRIRTLLVVGCETERSVDTTCRRASSEDLDVYLVRDAHSTTAKGGLSGGQVIEHHNWALEHLAQPDHPIRLVATTEVLAGF